MAQIGAGEVSRKVRAHTALLEDLSLAPSTHIGWLTIACNSSSNRATACTHMYSCSHTNTLNIKRPIKITAEAGRERHPENGSCALPEQHSRLALVAGAQVSQPQKYKSGRVGPDPVGCTTWWSGSCISIGQYSRTGSGGFR